MDMFGAQAGTSCRCIWDELIAAGFESGHAYGKSLRTVKSCVGIAPGAATACRTAWAWPWSWRTATRACARRTRSSSRVSGCTRECAEAQSKDIGVIATEKGWNLYVCGNGGMKPAPCRTVRHPTSTTQDLVRMHRPRADVLRAHRRPAAAHQHLAREPRRWPGLPQGRAPSKTAWACAPSWSRRCSKWSTPTSANGTTAVTDPETRKRFRTFVNSDQPDENVVFVQERGQIRPASTQERPPAPRPTLALRRVA